MKHEELMKEAVSLMETGWREEAISSHFGLAKSTVRHWMYAYRVFGREALLDNEKKSYSQETKLEAVRLFLDEGLPKPQVMERLGIKSLSSLERWVREYREEGAEALAPKPKGRRPKPKQHAYASREEELEACIRELELELEIQKRINALADEIEQKRRLR